METFEAVRLAASRLHRAACDKGADAWAPSSIVDVAKEVQDVEVTLLAAGNPQLMGGRGVFDPSGGIIRCERLADPVEQAILIAHEIGHAVMHTAPEPVVTERVDASRMSEGASSVVERVVDYGRRERRELQADLFARELLLPRERARDLYLSHGLGAKDIANRSGLPYALVAQQLLDAVLLPIPMPVAEVASPKPAPPLDSSQELAAAHTGSPFQLQAGPGTGKTKTLIARIERLIDQGVDPGTILVLTFSNKAAGELIDRLTRSRPAHASAVWIGTFHSFGLDILRRFHDVLGLPSDPRLADKADAVGLLEDLVAVLPLRHFRNFFDPTADIGDMLSAISRAKDEVCDEKTYRRLADAMVAKAKASSDAEAMTRAEKVADVATLYEAYQKELATARLLDFGDLVMRPVELVEANAGVRAALAERQQHVLVDEYQDVNRASVRLLKAIVGDGKRLWVVGDARQSIYRFRGASSTNMTSFANDFPGATVAALKVNYRSGKEIVDAFCGFAAEMKASSGMLPLALTSNRGGGGPKMEIRRVGRSVDEGAAVAATILELTSQGVPFRDQAVICRGNARLGEIASALEDRDIPVLYLGNLFERSDVRDLLSILALLVDRKAGTLPRIAAMARSPIALADVAEIQKLAATCEKPLQWLAAASRLSWSPETANSLATLEADLHGFDPDVSPWTALTGWLLDRTDMLRNLCASNRPRDQIRRVGLWQFLAFCRTLPRNQSGRPIQRLLDRARRLSLLLEERDLRQMPSAASGLDAVNLMTVHGSKGLEFEAVHMPGMTVASFPLNNTAPRCPPPDGMVAGADGLSGVDAVKKGHEEEEQCLFFVGMSRAHSRVFFYASTKQANGNNRSPSPFLAAIQPHATVLEPAPLEAPVTDDGSEALPDVDIAWATAPRVTQDQLAQYERCPRRYFLTHVLGVPGARTSTPYSRMQDVVNEVVRRVRDDATKWDLTTSEVEAFFEPIWLERGPVDYPRAEDYRAVGLKLVETLAASRRGQPYVPAPSADVNLAGATIVVRADEVRSGGTRPIWRRVRSGKARSTEADDIVYALMTLGGRSHGLAGVDAIFLTDGTTAPIALRETKFANQINKATRLAGSLVAGQFPAVPDPRSCPRCPHYFTCGTLPGGPLARP